METSDLLQTRMWSPDYYPEVAAWWSDRGKVPPPLAILPKCGVIIDRIGEHDDSEMIAALWLYLDNSVGVCFLDRVVTRPGLSMVEARNALLTGVELLRRLADSMDYGVMLIRAYPALMRFLRRDRRVCVDAEPVECALMVTREWEGDHA